MKIRYILCLALALVLISMSSVFASPIIFDDAKLLKENEKQQVQAELQKVADTHQVDIAIVTLSSLPKNVSLGDYANKLLDQVNRGANGNMVFLLNMDTRDFYVATDNKLRNVVYETEGVAYMSEAFLPKLKSKDYTGTFVLVAQKTGELCDYYAKNGKPWRQEVGKTSANAEDEGMGLPLQLLIALALAGVVTFLVRSSLISSMNNVHAVSDADAYFDDSSFQLSRERDMYLYTDIKREPKSQATKSSGVTTTSSDSRHGGGGGKF
ncbi:hypothetical protein TAMA11512_16830 [Selenomonas sp. TAMA-11512]|uniref:TPM domain-containing protein n=1 Tax=Selenomonas sp. TAMA-11512 TaxID=3095337 RepID=UPI00308CA090|nr:hypothetical protein TAMA11512_16830 [Selenomonas sp. TAMA-11512]